jgi:hypothetical protein
LTTLNTITLHDLLLKHNITYIDYLQIDAEGMDFVVLSQIPFHKLTPRVIQYEQKHLLPPEKKRSVSFLSSYNYTVIEGGAPDFDVTAYSETAWKTINTKRYTWLTFVKINKYDGDTETVIWWDVARLLPCLIWWFIWCTVIYLVHGVCICSPGLSKDKRTICNSIVCSHAGCWTERASTERQNTLVHHQYTGQEKTAVVSLALIVATPLFKKLEMFFGALSTRSYQS